MSVWGRPSSFLSGWSAPTTPKGKLSLTIHGTPRADSNGGPILANRLGDRFEDLQSESGPVLDRPSVLVRPLVRHILQELVYQVPVCTMDHDAVESGLVDSGFSSSLEPLNVFFDLRDGKRSRGDAGTAEFDVGWTDRDDVLTWAFDSEKFGLGGWTDSPQLEVDE